MTTKNTNMKQTYNDHGYNEYQCFSIWTLGYLNKQILNYLLTLKTYLFSNQTLLQDSFAYFVILQMNLNLNIHLHCKVMNCNNHQPLSVLVNKTFYNCTLPKTQVNEHVNFTI